MRESHVLHIGGLVQSQATAALLPPIPRAGCKRHLQQRPQLLQAGSSCIPLAMHQTAAGTLTCSSASSWCRQGPAATSSRWLLTTAAATTGGCAAAAWFCRWAVWKGTQGRGCLHGA